MADALEAIRAARAAIAGIALRIAARRARRPFRARSGPRHPAEAGDRRSRSAPSRSAARRMRSPASTRRRTPARRHLRLDRQPWPRDRLCRRPARHPRHDLHVGPGAGRTRSRRSARSAPRCASSATARTMRKRRSIGWPRRAGSMEIPPFDHPDVIAGQGTIGLELLEDFPDLDSRRRPALRRRADRRHRHRGQGCRRRRSRIVGVSMERGAAMHASLAAGRPVDVVEEPTWRIRSAAASASPIAGHFEMVRDLVDEIVLVPEARDRRGDAGALPRRGLGRRRRRRHRDRGAPDEARAATLGDRVAIIISGQNVDMTRFQQAIVGGRRGSEGGECRA